MALYYQWLQWVSIELIRGRHDTHAVGTWTVLLQTSTTVFNISRLLRSTCLLSWWQWRIMNSRTRLTSAICWLSAYSSNDDTKKHFRTITASHALNWMVPTGVFQLTVNLTDRQWLQLQASDSCVNWYYLLKVSVSMHYNLFNCQLVVI